MNDVALRELDRTECLALLTTEDLGQVALTQHALPVVVPAHYVVHTDHVIIHLSTGLDHLPWTDGEVVALHVTVLTDDRCRGWSVSVTGRAHGIPNPLHDENQPTAPWIAHGGGDLISLSTDFVRGQRLGAGACVGG